MSVGTYEVVVTDDETRVRRKMHVLAESLDDAAEWGHDWVRSQVFGSRKGWYISASSMVDLEKSKCP